MLRRRQTSRRLRGILRHRAPASTTPAAAGKADAAARQAAVVAPPRPAAKGEDEGHHRGNHSDCYCAGEHPGEQTHHPASRGSAEKAPQDRTQDRPTDERRNKQNGECLPDSAFNARRRARWFRERLAVDQPHHAVERGVDAAGEVAFAKARHDDLADDPARGRIVQHALEPVADLDADRAVVLGDDEDRAIVDLLPADFPLLAYAQGVLLDRFRRGRGHDQHRELRALARLELLQHALEPRLLLPGQGAGEVGDTRGERRDRDLGPRGGRDQEQNYGTNHCFFWPKSTLGAVEIARSLSTVKLGLVLKPNNIAVRFDGNERTVTL